MSRDYGRYPLTQGELLGALAWAIAERRRVELASPPLRRRTGNTIYAALMECERLINEVGCEMPDCEGRGVLGNETIVDGKRMCDYCHARIGPLTEE